MQVHLLKAKAASLHWKSMFARSVFQTADMIRQHELLSEVAGLFDAGALRTTLAERYGRVTAENLRRAHAVSNRGTRGARSCSRASDGHVDDAGSGRGGGPRLVRGHRRSLPWRDPETTPWAVLVSEVML